MAEPKKSKSFQEFVAGVRAPMTWANIDEYQGLAAFNYLSGAERTEAEDILIERLTHNDGRAAYALAEIGCTRALAALHARLPASAPGLMRLAAATALHRLGDDSGRAAAIDVLGTGDRMERLSAVSALSQWSGAEVEQGLEQAFADPDSTVRSAAAGTLIQLHGLQELNRGYQDRLGQLQNRLSSPLAAVRADALAELHDIFARSERGEAPEQLGLTWRADDEHEPFRTFAASLQSNDPPWQDDFPLQLIASLAGRERTWAEDCLWHFLPTDPRAARAFASLGVERAIAPLREVLPVASGALAIEVAAALWHLGGDTTALERLRAATHEADASLAARAKAALGESD
jgi:HEAT repeat protein